MSYTKQAWNPDDRATPLSAPRLTHLEDGIEAAATDAESRALANHTHPELPSPGQKNALAGTQGTPGLNNLFVTNADPRLSDSRTPAQHFHAQSEISNLVADLAAKANLVSGRVPTSELGGAGADVTKFLRGDGTWAAPTGAGRLEIDLRPITGTVAAWTNMPAAETDFLGTAGTPYRKVADLSGSTEARLKCNQTVAGATGALLKAQYSTDGNTWTDLCSVAVGAGTGVKVGTFAAIPQAARIIACHIRLRGIGGDGVADPAWHFVSVEVR